MSSVEQISIIKEFCKCVLDKTKDSSDFLGLTDAEKLFCMKYHNKFKELGKEINDNSIITIVRVACDTYCKDMLLENKTPFLFHNKQFVDNYLNAITEHCKNNFQVDVPVVIQVILRIIELECLEYQNASLHIQQVINSNMNSHIERMNGIDKRIDGINDIIDEKTEETSEKLKKDFNEELEQNSKKFNESSIAVLGIFSAVVLTFNAALTFTSSVLESISKSSIYRIAFISLLIGFVLINVIYGLFSFIKSLVKNNEKQHLKALIFTDILIIVMLGILIYSWSNGSVEKRNQELDNNTTTTTCISEHTETTIQQKPRP